MDMKRILQAFDGAATKPVAGVNDMSKFLNIVSEAEQVPAMPDITGIQPGSSKDLGSGTSVTVNADGTVSYSGGWGTYIYNAQGQHIKTQSPTFAGYSQATDANGNVTQQNYQQGPMSVQKGPNGTTANYQLGAQNLQTQVQENDLSKFLSIIEKNDVEILNEGANPHKVTLPVQMAMQHYQQPTKLVEPKKPSLLKKYFAEAEAAVEEQKEEQRQIVRQYAQKIADRVLMKESALKDKEDLKAKRKALQDIQLDPNTDKDPQLKDELAYRKAALEKEAKKKGLSENQEPAQQAVRDERVINQEIKAAAKEVSKVEYTLAKVREVTKEIKYDDTASSIVLRIRALGEAVPNIDKSDLKYAEDAVFEAARALESAVYGLEEAFNDAVRHAKNAVDELESEVDEIRWNRDWKRNGEE